MRSVIATDIDGPTDISSTSYSIDGAPSIFYSSPFAIFADGTHTIQFKSVDKAGNVETVKSVTFIIDSTPPTITVATSSPTLWPPNGKFVPNNISGMVADGLSGIDPSTVTFRVVDKYGQVQPTGVVSVGPNGQFAFSVVLEASRLGQDLDGREYQIIVSCKDMAGNEASASTMVIVPHDQRQ